MKKYFTFLPIVSILFTLFFLSDAESKAQNSISIKDSSNNTEEAILRNHLRQDGISDQAIDNLILYRKLILEQKKNNPPAMTILKNQTPVSNALCSDMGGENGWGAWKAATGDYLGGSVTFTSTNLTPSAPRFNLTSGVGIDACTPGPGAGNPLLPVVCPGFGNASIQLGQIQSNGSIGGCNYGCVEQLTYPLAVTAADTDFIYSYAMVIEDPGHPVTDQPFVSISINDPSGNPIPCGYIKYTAGGSIPGFYQSNCNVNSISYYKPWTTVGVNLASYVGQILTVVLTNADCGQGGHFAQSYWDFSCGPIPIDPCSGSATSICAPSDPLINYTYQWYKNGTVMAAPAGTQQCISITPNSGDSYIVNVSQPSGCNFNMSYVANGYPMQSLFTYSLNSNVITCTNLSTSATYYAWNFGDGSTSTATNPVHTFSATGTYTVCLVASSSGCADTVCKIINIAAVSLQEQETLSSFSVYPMPASKNITLDFGNDNFGQADISFNDLLGRMIRETKIAANGKQSLDVSELINGIYFLQLKSGYGIMIKKIIISH